MKAFQCALVLAACLFTVHAADEFDKGLSLAESEARAFFLNFTSSLIQVRKMSYTNKNMTIKTNNLV